MQKTCTQCGGLLTGHYQFYVCSACYSANVAAAQKALLLKEKHHESRR